MLRYRVVLPDPTRLPGIKTKALLSRLATFRAFLRCLADEDYIWRDEAKLPGRRRWAGPRRLLARLLENPRLIRVVLAPSFEVVQRAQTNEAIHFTGSAISGLEETWVSRAAGLWGVELHDLDFDVELALVRRPESFDAFIPFATFQPADRSSMASAPNERIRPGIGLAVPKGLMLTTKCPSVLARAYVELAGPWTSVGPAQKPSGGPVAHDPGSVIHGVVPVKGRDGARELLTKLDPHVSLWPSALWAPPLAGGSAITPQASTCRSVDLAAWIGATTSWYHFILEGLCAYLSIEGVAHSRPPICIQSGTPTQIRELALRFTGVEPIVCGPHEEVRFDRLWTAGIPVLRRIEDFDEEAVAQVIALRQALEERVSSREDPGGKRYYFYRGAGTLRRLRNQRQVADILKDRGFEPIEAGTLNLAEQTATLRRAEAVVMESGAAFAGLLFCTQGAKVLEIGPRNDGTGFWGEFAHRLGLRHVGVWSPNLLSAGRFRAPGAVGYRISRRALVDGLDLLGV